MNKDQALGTLKEIMGNLQEKIGDAMGSRRQQAKGIRKKLEGKIQKTFGDAREHFKGVRRV